MNNYVKYCSILLLLTSVVYSSNMEKEVMEKEAELGTSSLSLQAYSESKIGKLSTSWNMDDLIMKFEIQGSIDEDKKQGTFADLDGLKNGSKVTFGVEKWNIVFNNFDETKDTYNKICAKQLALNAQIIKKHLACIQLKQKGKLDEKTSSECNKYKELVENQPKCDLTKAVEPELFAHVFGFYISGGQQKYNWLTQDNLEKESASKKSYSLEFVYGYITPKFGRINFGLRYEEIWKENDTMNICSPDSTYNTSFVCNNLPIGSPEEKNAKIAYVEWKKRFGEYEQYAIAPRISRDFENDINGFQLPIYLFGLKDLNGVTGGVSLEWNDDDKDTSVSVFFTKKFSITQ